jgi:hypothetical protein
LVERERLGRGFEQCLIAADDVVRAEQVGEGTQGLVFRGRWRGVDVAIKERRDASVAYLEQFRAEALRMHSIAVHENVCQFLGVLLSPSFAIVTRFYPLGCLEDHVYKTRAEVLLTPAFVRRALLAWRAACGTCTGSAWCTATSRAATCCSRTRASATRPTCAPPSSASRTRRSSASS